MTNRWQQTVDVQEQAMRETGRRPGRRDVYEYGGMDGFPVPSDTPKAAKSKAPAKRAKPTGKASRRKGRAKAAKVEGAPIGRAVRKNVAARPVADRPPAKVVLTPRR